MRCVKVDALGIHVCVVHICYSLMLRRSQFFFSSAYPVCSQTLKFQCICMSVMPNISLYLKNLPDTNYQWIDLKKHYCETMYHHECIIFSMFHEYHSHQITNLFYLSLNEKFSYSQKSRSVEFQSGCTCIIQWITIIYYLHFR